MTKPNCDCSNDFEIIEVDSVSSEAGAEDIKKSLVLQFSKSWNTKVKVRTYQEVAADLRASDCEMAAAAKIFLKQALRNA